MRHVLLVLVSMATVGCENAKPWSEREGCHFVSCGDMVDGFDEPRCSVIVNNRSVASVPTGQDAIDFIQRNGLRTCTPPEGL